MRPSPSFAIALVALFIALGGSAVAAGVLPPLAKRALVANNSLKLQGKTAAQVAALVPPPTVTSVASLVSVQTANFNLDPQSSGQFSVSCSGAKAISGGFSSGQAVFGADSSMSSDGATYTELLVNADTAAATGTIYAVCLK
jgi:hypothetical protein